MSSLGRRRAVCFVLAAIFGIASGRAMAQDDFGPGGPSMAGLSGGQMVRGLVTSAGRDQIALKTDKGEVYKVTVTSNTRIVKDRQPFKLASIRAGDSLGAMGVLDAPAKTVHALFVVVVDAEQARKAREGLGKIYIAGKVTAIDELRLTILRPDNVTQVIAVDEGTSFRRGGRQILSAINGFGPSENVAARAPNAADASAESITLSDIKVGDTVAGKGELKGGTFVPSQLAVVDAATARQHRRRQEGGLPVAAPAAQLK